MKIALIHCPFAHQVFSENLRVVDEEFCLAPPIVLAYVAAILEKAGHRVMIVEANALQLSKEQALEVLQRFAPDIIGFRADTYWFHRVVEWAAFFKERLNIRIIVGGINVSLYPRETLSYHCFDYGIAGEANESLPQLLFCLENGLATDTIKGLVYRSTNGVICNPPSDNLVDFDHYPFPARHLLPNSLYSSFTSQRKNFTVILTNLGCHYACSFCAISRQRLRFRSPGNVVDEIEECYRDFGIREVDFFSPSFFVDKTLAREICDNVIKRNIKIEWSCRSRVDQVDRDILARAYAAGCRKIYYGIESVSPNVLGNIEKGITIDQVKEAVSLTRRCKIKTLGFFMVGNPGDTKESILATIDFAKSLKLDYVQVCKTIAKPDTQLNDLVTKCFGRDYWRDYVLGGKPDFLLPRPWTSLREEELDRYVDKFYREFYFRPSYIMRRLFNTKSIDELMRYVKVVFKWFFLNSRQ